MAMYIAGKQYYRNRITGAVFTYRPSLSRLGDLELHDVDEDGNLVKVGVRQPQELNPTATPEKVAKSTASKDKPVQKTATMTPVEQK